MSRRVWYRVILFLILLLGVPVSVVRAARTVSISSSSTSLFGDEEIVLTASASGFTDGETIYMKGAFFQIGSSNYFGYSKTQDNVWVKNGETASVQPAAVIGIWDNLLSIKSDFSDGGYKGEGEYGLKLGFYYKTAGGSLSPVTWSANTLMITLSEPDPTATALPTPTPTPQATHTPTPTLYLSSTPTSGAASATRGITPIKNVVVLPTETYASDILGIGIVTGGSISHEVATYSGNMDESIAAKKPSPIVFVLLFLGVGTSLLACGLSLEKIHV